MNIALPNNRRGSWEYHDGGQLLHHKESDTWYVLARNEEGILNWVESPFSHEMIDAFSQLGVGVHGDATGPLPHQTFSGGIELD